MNGRGAASARNQCWSNGSFSRWPGIGAGSGKTSSDISSASFQRLASARTGETIRANAAPARHHRSAHQAIVKRRRNHGGLPIPRGAGNDELGLVDGASFRGSRRPGRRPMPSRRESPSRSRGRREINAYCKRPTAVGIAQRRVLSAVVRIEQDERVSAPENIGALAATELRSTAQPDRGLFQRAPRRRGIARHGARAPRGTTRFRHVPGWGPAADGAAPSAGRRAALEDNRRERASRVGREHDDSTPEAARRA